jgi:hydrogenase maturation factor HypF (carbamoyltransferase family)
MIIQKLVDFPYKIIYNLIKKQVNSICEIIKNILESSNNEIISIILVGGYCSNEILISEIKNQLSNKITYFLQPSKPSLAIYEGAVLFGLNQNKNIQKKNIN